MKENLSHNVNFSVNFRKFLKKQRRHFLAMLWNFFIHLKIKYMCIE